MTGQPAEPGLRARKNERTRRDLRESVARRFAAHGHAATTAADVAAANASEPVGADSREEEPATADSRTAEPATAGPREEEPATASGTAEPATAPGSPAGRRRTRLLITAGVAATAIAVTGVGDLLLEHTARQRIVDAATCRLRPTGQVSARLTGTLAGLRLLTGKVGTIHINARDVQRDGTRLTVSADLHDVTIRGATSGGSATATLGYGELRKRLGSAAGGLAPGSDGAGRLVLRGRLGGIPLPVTVRTRLTATADSVTVTPADVTVLGRVFPVDRLAAVPATAGLAERLAPRTVTLPALPRGVRLTSARAGESGLTLTLALPRSEGGSDPGGCARDAS